MSEMKRKMTKIALELTAKNWSIIPVETGTKKPAINWKEYQERIAKPEEVKEWFDQKDHSLGLVTGDLSNVVVVDCDTKETARDFYKILRGLGVENTLRVITGRGVHFYFQYREGIRNDAGKVFGTGIDIRGQGGYVLIPPSIHPNGATYTWCPGPILALPDELYHKVSKNLTATQIIDKNKNFEGSVISGERNNALTSMAGAMRKVGFDIRSIYPALLEYNRSHCSPPLLEEEIKTITNSVCRYATENITRSIIGVQMSDVKPETIHWLWGMRIPLGKLTLIEGDGGLGKSYLTLYIAAKISTGEMMSEPRKVVLMSAEDGLSDTIRPRLTAMGANLHNVIAVTGIKDRSGEKAISLKELPLIESLVIQHKPALLVIDPVIAFMSGSDTNRAGDVRSLLAPLASMANKSKLSVLMVRHLNKNSDQKATYRGQGSADFYNACRSAFMVVRDPEDSSKCVLCQTKNNLAPLQKTLHFWLEDNAIVMGRESYITADQALANKD